MSLVRVLAAAAFAAALVGAGLVTQADAAKCAKIGGEGTGLGEPIAKDQANMALAEAIKAYGGKASGKASLKCTMTLVLATCTATQTACK
jgi:hypothetical protein